MSLYHTILADPAWRQTLISGGTYKSARNRRPKALPYPTMSLSEIKALPVADFAADGCHLWLWTTNEFLRAGFDVMEAWGFTYLAPIHWIKPSGCGNYFIHRTQTLLFGYRERCRFPLARYVPNVIIANPGKHSRKPPESYDLVESVSPPHRLELFARERRAGWHVWGNEVESDVTISSVAPLHTFSESPTERRPRSRRSSSVATDGGPADDF